MNYLDTLKKGDKIIIVEWPSMASLTGQEAEVVQGGNISSGRVKILTERKQRYTLYSDASIIYATKEARIESLKERIKEAEKSIVSLKSELEFHEKFDSQEDFVAHKLDAILTAHAEGKTKGKRTSAIADILKELKQTNLL